MIKSRKGQEGFTLIELLVVVLIIGILAAIAIPAFLGQKKGAQDSNAKSLLRNSAIAMESYYSEHQSFDGATAGTALVKADMDAIEPNMVWAIAAAAPTINTSGVLAKNDQVTVLPTKSVAGATNPNDGYTLYTTSASGSGFTYIRSATASVRKCKDAAAWDTACTTNEW